MTDGRCVEMIHDGMRAVSFHRCSYRGVVSRNGKMYCRIHDPEAVKYRQAERDKKRDRLWNRKKRKWRMDEIARLLAKRYLDLKPNDRLAVEYRRLKSENENEASDD